MNVKIKISGAQGDTLILRVDRIPDGAVEQPRGRIIVAHSETGHHHVIDAGARHYTTTNPMVSYLAVDGDYADVVHLRDSDTHKTELRLLGDIMGEVYYEVHRQRFATPESWRTVTD